MILPAALYFWQIPHFMALAYLCRNDYLAGGYLFFFLFLDIFLAFLNIYFLMLSISLFDVA
jgi:hypothetical protein